MQVIWCLKFCNMTKSGGTIPRSKFSPVPRWSTPMPKKHRVRSTKLRKRPAPISAMCWRWYTLNHTKWRIYSDHSLQSYFQEFNSLIFLYCQTARTWPCRRATDWVYAIILSLLYAELSAILSNVTEQSEKKSRTSQRVATWRRVRGRSAR